MRGGRGRFAAIFVLVEEEESKRDIRRVSRVPIDW